MSTIRVSRVATLVSVAISIVAYALADRFMVLAAAAIPAALLGWWLTEIKRLTPVPKLAINLLVTVAIVWSFYRVVSDRGVEGLTVSVFCQFLVLVLLVKLWDRKDARDIAQVLTLSIFLTIGAILTANTLGVGLAVILNVVVSIFAVMSFHVAVGVERLSVAARAVGESGAVDADASRPIRGSFLSLCVTSLVLGLVVSVVVWVIMPRGIGESEFGGLGQFGGRRTGFTERVDLRRSGLITESTRAVLDLRIENGQGFSIGTEGRHVYLRGAVLDLFDGRAWTKSAASGLVTDMKVQAGTSWKIGPTQGTMALVQRIVMRDVASSGVPVLAALNPVAIELEADAQLAFRYSARTLTRDGRAGRFAYTVTSVAPRVDDERSQVVRGTSAQFSSTRITAEAGRVLAEAGIEPDPDLRPPAWDLDACRALEKHLRVACTYTLDTKPVRAGQDPIEEFLFVNQTGHCEYFASAMAAMTRSVGIPARVVAGYVANEFSLDTETYTVRENSAHAWVEAMVGEGVWMTFDPTPPDGLLQQIRPPARFLAGWQQWLDSLDNAWSTSVVTFDEQSRKKLLGADANPASWVHEHVASWMAEFRNSDAQSRMRAVARIVTAVLTLTLLGWLGTWVVRFFLSRWRSSPRRSRGWGEPQLCEINARSKFYFDILANLRKLGMAKPDWRPPLDHADAINESLPASRALRQAASLYYAARFGLRELTPDEIEASRRAALDLRHGPARPAPRSAVDSE